MSQKVPDDNKIYSNDVDFKKTDNPEAYLMKILRDAQKEKLKLEEQKIATLNILEDMSESQEELRVKFQELKIIKELIQKLGTSFDPLEITKHIAKSVLSVFPDIKIACANFLMFGAGNIKNIYFFDSDGVSEEYLAAIKNNMLAFVDDCQCSSVDEATIAAWKNPKQIEFKIVEGVSRINSDMPLSMVNIPMNIEGLVCGFFNFSLSNADITEREIRFFKTLLESASQTVVHIRQLVFSEHSRLRDLIQSMTNGVLMFDVDWRVTAVNPIFKKMVFKQELGYNLKEFLDYFAAQEKDGSKNLDLKYFIEKTLKSGRPTYIDEVYFSKAIYEASVVPVHDYANKVTGGAIILHDITHIKEIDELKTEFVSVASHQLRTPLTAIKLFVEMLLGDGVGKINDEQREYLSDIQESSNRMVRLVNNLLNVSRIETDRLKIEPQDTDIIAFISQAIEEIKSLAELRKCDIKFRKPKLSIETLSIDQTLMHQVIHNLLINSIHYSKPDGGTINVDISEDKDHVIISVKDNGIGIPESSQKKIFQKFYRADNAIKVSTEGSGLGMYVVKMIVEASGGRIWFESEENKGSCFYVLIQKSGMKKKAGEKTLVV